MSPDQWSKLKKSEKEIHSKKNLGAYGITKGFKSRSLQAFQADLEKGKTGHLMPMFDAARKLKSGTIKADDIPYMQRSGGSWDGSDVGKKKKWSSSDRNYRPNASPSRPGYELGFVKRGRTGAAGKSEPLAKPHTKKLFGIF